MQFSRVYRPVLAREPRGGVRGGRGFSAGHRVWRHAGQGGIRRLWHGGPRGWGGSAAYGTGVRGIGWWSAAYGTGVRGGSTGRVRARSLARPSRASLSLPRAALPRVPLAPSRGPPARPSRAALSPPSTHAFNHPFFLFLSLYSFVVIA